MLKLNKDADVVVSFCKDGDGTLVSLYPPDKGAAVLLAVIAALVVAVAADVLLAVVTAIVVDTVTASVVGVVDLVVPVVVVKVVNTGNVHV